jgi:hypothetical protein
VSVLYEAVLRPLVLLRLFYACSFLRSLNLISVTERRIEPISATHSLSPRVCGTSDNKKVHDADVSELCRRVYGETTGWTTGDRFPPGTEGFSVFYTVETRSGGHLACYRMDTGVNISLRVKRSGHETDQSPPSSTEVMNYGTTWSDNKVRELDALEVLHTSLLNIAVVAFKVLPLGSYATIPAPSRPFKTILELVL